MATTVEEKQIEPEGYQAIDSALSQLRRTIIALFSRLINANKNLEKDPRQMKMALTKFRSTSCQCRSRIIGHEEIKFYC